VILMDTDVCVELLRGNLRVIEHRRKSADDVAIAFITVGELFYGVERSSQPARNRDLVEHFLLSVACLHSNRVIMETFGVLKAGLTASGMPLPDADILIAATAITHGAMLITGNATHFARFTGLKVQDWTR